MRLEVTVVPKSGSFRLEMRPDGGLKVFLKSAPEGNKANLELVKEMRRLLKADVRLVSGLTSRKKVLDVALTQEEVERILLTRA